MLSADQLRRAIFCAVEERQARERGKTPGLARWNDELIAALYDELAEISSARQQSDANNAEWQHDEDDDLSSHEVAELLGWHVRKVQRNYRRLGGQKIGTSLVFHKSAIVEYLEGKHI